jgi:hypothetical protein
VLRRDWHFAKVILVVVAHQFFQVYFFFSRWSPLHPMQTCTKSMESLRRPDRLVLGFRYDDHSRYHFELGSSHHFSTFCSPLRLWAGWAEVAKREANGARCTKLAGFSANCTHSDVLQHPSDAKIPCGSQGLRKSQCSVNGKRRVLRPLLHRAVRTPRKHPLFP